MTGRAPNLKNRKPTDGTIRRVVSLVGILTAVLLVTGIALGATTATDTESVTVEGAVTDAETGNPIENADVTLLNETGYVASHLTTESGEYEFPSVGHSDFTIRVTADGYDEYEETFSDSGETIEKDIELTPGNIVEDWAQSQSDVRHTGTTADSGPNRTVTTEWTFETTGNSADDTTPALYNGTVFFGSETAHEEPAEFYAVDAETGEEQWRFEGDDDMNEPVVHDGTVYVTSDDETVYAFDANTGEIKWDYRMDVDSHPSGIPIQSAPAVANGNVYVHAGYDSQLSDQLFAIDADTGEEQWTAETSHDSGPAPEPIVIGSTVYTAHNHDQYRGGYYGWIRGFNSYTGEREETRLTHDFGDPILTPVFDREAIYTSEPRRDTLHKHQRFGPAAGEQLWTFEFDNSPGVPTVSGGTVYIATDGETEIGEGLVGPGSLHAIDGATGNEDWVFTPETDEHLVRSPAIAGETIYISGSSGTMYMIDATSGEEIASFDAETDGRFSSPVVTEDRIFATNDDGKLYAFSETEFKVNITETPKKGFLTGTEEHVRATIENIGDETRTQTVTLSVGGVDVAQEDVTVGSGGSETIETTYTASEADMDSVDVEIESDDDTATETVAVLLQPELSITDFGEQLPTEDELPEDGPADFGTVDVQIEETAGSETENLAVTLVILDEASNSRDGDVVLADDDSDGSLFEATIADRELDGETDIFSFDIGELDVGDEYTATVTADADNAEQVEETHSVTRTADDSVEIVGPVNESQEEFDVEVDGLDDMPVFLTVENEETGDLFTEGIYGDETVTITASEIGGIEDGDVITATLQAEVIGILDTDSVTVGGDDELMAAFTVEPDEPEVGQNTLMDASNSTTSSGEIVEYRWDISGDGQPDATTTDPKENFMFEVADVYDITLTVEDDTGETAETTQTVTVTEPPQPNAEFTVEPEQPTAGETITVNSDSSSAPESEIEEYRWDFTDDGEIDLSTSDRSTEWTYDEAGEYPVTLIVEDANGKTDQTTQTITVAELPQPTAEFTVDPEQPSPDETVTLSADGSTAPEGEIVDYRWDFTDDGEPDVTTADPSTDWTYDEAGTYTVTLTIEDENGETAQTTRTVTVETTTTTPTPTPTPDEPAFLTVDIDADESQLEVGTDGELVVVAVIKNTGEQSTAQGITAIINGTTTSESVALSSGERTTVELSFPSASEDWETVVVESQDDSDTAPVAVMPAEPANFEVAINGSSSTLDAYLGEEVTLATEVTNVGTETGSQTVELVDGDVVLDATSVELDGRNDAVHEFFWNTTDVEPGEYDLTVRTENDTASETVRVVDPRPERSIADSDLSEDETSTVSVTASFDEPTEFTIVEEFDAFGDAEIVDADGADHVGVTAASDGVVATFSDRQEATITYEVTADNGAAKTNYFDGFVEAGDERRTTTGADLIDVAVEQVPPARTIDETVLEPGETTTVTITTAFHTPRSFTIVESVESDADIELVDDDGAAFSGTAADGDEVVATFDDREEASVVVETTVSEDTADGELIEYDGLVDVSAETRPIEGDGAISVVAMPEDSEASASEQTEIVTDGDTPATAEFNGVSMVDTVGFSEETNGYASATVFDAEPEALGRSPDATLTVTRITVPEEVKDESATITMEVPIEQVEELDAEVDELRVDHFKDGEWHERDTQVVDQNDEAVIIEADTPGFSYFSVSAPDNSDALYDRVSGSEFLSLAVVLFCLVALTAASVAARHRV